MNCKRYRKWVKRAALNSLGASRQAKLDAHLGGCEKCRQLLDSELQLAEAINLALTASVATAQSADFAARVRVRLAEESELARPRLEWVRIGWIAAPVAGLVALATLLALIQPGSRHQKLPQTIGQTARATAPSTPSPTAGLPSVATDKTVAVTASGPAQGGMSHAAARPGRARTHGPAGIEDQAPQFQVLVEPGQWRAILVAYRAAQTAHLDADALAQTSDGDEQLEKIKPIEISPVVVAELYPEEPTKPAGQ